MAAKPTALPPQLAAPCRIRPSSAAIFFFPSAANFLTSTQLSVSSAASPAMLFTIPVVLNKSKRASKLFSVAQEDVKTATSSEGVENGAPEEDGAKGRPCELYVCNLPRSCDISQLLEVFKSYGTVISVEVSRDAETGISRGCGYVTMSSLSEARAAIAALDGSDMDGREVRVKFSGDMVSGRKNSEALTTTPKKNLIFESPHKAYVGNLAWSIRPESLREYFSQFGNVISARVLFDRKGAKNRVYGFVSFSSADELKAAVSKSGTEFHGRTMLIREVVKSEA